MLKCLVWIYVYEYLYVYIYIWLPFTTGFTYIKEELIIAKSQKEGRKMITYS